MRHLPVGGALLPLSSSGCRNPRFFEDGFTGCVVLDVSHTARSSATQPHAAPANEVMVEIIIIIPIMIMIMLTQVRSVMTQRHYRRVMLMLTDRAPDDLIGRVMTHRDRQSTLSSLSSPCQ
jgi:hypothetical protein